MAEARERRGGQHHVHGHVGDDGPVAVEEQPVEEGEHEAPVEAETGDDEAGVEDGHAGEHGEAADERVGVGQAVADHLGHPRAEGDAEQPGQAHDDAELEGDVGLGDALAVRAGAARRLGAEVGELGAPPHEGADGEGGGGEGDGGVEVALVLVEGDEVVLGGGGSEDGALGLAAGRVLKDVEDEEDGDEAQTGGEAEAPAPVGGHVGDLGAHDVAEAGADGDGEVEEGEDLGAGVLAVEVGDDGGGDGGVGRLADAHQHAEEHEPPEVLHQGSHQGGEGPDGDAHQHDVAAVVAVAKVPEI